VTISESLLPEYDHEMKVTRTCIERVPDAKWDWAPHEKSMTLGRLASHLVDSLDWATASLTTTEFDIAPPGAPPFEPAFFKNTKETLAEFDKRAATTRQAIERSTDQDLFQDWSLLKGGQKIFTMPRAAILRSFLMNHNIHHRGQLSVYLRLCNVPVPSIYGPSADEGSM
jgi:uncharacterized damage-inducible protein DinB